MAADRAHRRSIRRSNTETLRNWQVVEAGGALRLELYPVEEDRDQHAAAGADHRDRRRHIRHHIGDD
jgi:hypothetical protein